MSDRESPDGKTVITSPKSIDNVTENVPVVSDSTDKPKRTGEMSNRLSKVPHPPPNGGLRAWLVAIGGFCTMCCTFGYINSFGVYQNYYDSILLVHRSRSDVSWIGSLQGCFLFLGGLLSGPLLDRYGARAVLVPASLTLVFSIMMTSLSTQYYQLILSQGVLTGIGAGLIYTPSVSATGQWFTTRRGLAMAVVATGGSVGGVIWPIITDRLLNASRFGFGWTLRIVGFAHLGLLLVACCVLVEHAPRRKTKFFLPRAFRQIPYTLTALSAFLTFFGLWGPIFFIVDYSVANGVGRSRAFYEVAVLNGTSFFGRLLSGYLADKFGRYNLLTLCLVASAVILFCWTAARSYAGITVFTAIYGVFSGAVVSLYPVCVAQISPSPADIGTYFGMALACASVSILTTGPIIGAIISVYGYLQASMFAAAMVLAGAVAAAAARLLLKQAPFCVV